jgi:alkanesulfonate monooxygenase SsuD/methylene tetrahydromethanopterin reductase-like flavin-dependent oxidoreductase (luciferase family)
MKYGFVLPYGDARTAADLAHDAEQAGWDGFFVWEPVWGIDAWICLAAAAVRTERIRLGTMLSPLSRMRPWKLASETVTLDHLSGGRTILSVGLGAPDTGFDAFGEVTDRRTRAELLDEGLQILTGLWGGQPFSFEGRHYRVKPTNFFPPPPPLQQPLIPIWVVGAWPYPKSMQRALRYDGLLPYLPGAELTPAAISEMKAYIAANRTLLTPFDIVVEGVTPGEDAQQAAAVVKPWAEAGATWWIEALWEQPGQEQDLERIRRRVWQGPPLS